MKILVAGGAGFVGTTLVPMLLEHGYEVDVIDLMWFGNRLPEGVGLIRKNLFDITPEDLRTYGCVVFLAGVSNDPMAEFNPAMNFVYNGALPSFLAFRAKQAGVPRFVYACSCSIYGYTINELYDEDSPVTCAYPYGISKLEGERGVLQLIDEDFSAISLRQGTVNGYSPRMRFDLIVNTMFKCAITGGKITVNNPSIWRPLIDVRDTSMAFLRAIQADSSISGAFNVAYGNYTVGQVADLVKDEVEELTGRRVNVEIKDVQDFRNYKVSCDRAKRVLGFSPKYDVTDTIKSLHGRMDKFGDFSDDSFYNIRIFKGLDLDKHIPVG